MHACRNAHLIGLCGGDFARTAAIRALLAAFHAGAIAFRANGIMPHADGTHGALGRLFQADHDRSFDVASRRGPAAKTARETAAAENLFKEIAEARAAKFKAFRPLFARTPGISATRSAATISAWMRLKSTFPIGAEIVVFFAFIGVAENLVGLVDLLEFFLGLFFVLGYVRMILPRQTAESLADFVTGRVAVHTQNFIVIFKFHRHKIRRTIYGSTIARYNEM